MKPRVPLRPSLPGADFNAVFTFNNGVKYILAFFGDDMYLESTDMSCECYYKTDSAAQFTAHYRSMFSERINPLNDIKE